MPPSWITALSWQSGLCKSMKLWAMLCRATQNEWIVVKSSDKTWSTGGGNDNPLQDSCFKNPMNCMKRQKDRTPKDDPPSLQVGRCPICYWEEWRAITNSSRKNEAAGPKWKECLGMDVSGGKSKIRCCKEQNFIGTWNVRSMNQGKLDVVKRERVRVNISVRNQWNKMDVNRWIYFRWPLYLLLWARIP